MATSKKSHGPALKSITKQPSAAQPAKKVAAPAKPVVKAAAKVLAAASHVGEKTTPRKAAQTQQAAKIVQKAAPAAKKPVQSAPAAAKKAAAAVKVAQPSRKPVEHKAALKAKPVVKKTALAAKKAASAPKAREAVDVMSVMREAAKRGEKSLHGSHAPASVSVVLHHEGGSDTVFDEVKRVSATPQVKSEGATLAAAGAPLGTRLAARTELPSFPHGLANLAASTGEGVVLGEPVPVVKPVTEPTRSVPDTVVPSPTSAAPANWWERDCKPRSAWVTAPAPSAPRPAVVRVSAPATSPALLMRRYEVYPDGLGAYRWRLMIASTGQEVAVSKGSFGTPSEAEQSANNEARFYQQGTVTVVRLGTSPRGPR